MSRIVDDICHYFQKTVGVDLLSLPDSVRRELIAQHRNALLDTALRHRDEHWVQMVNDIVAAEIEAERDRKTIRSLRSACHDLYDIVLSEYEYDSDPIDLKSWERALKKAREVIHIKHRKEA